LIFVSDMSFAGWELHDFSRLASYCPFDNNGRPFQPHRATSYRSMRCSR
jgi:hypothetical protein